MDTNINRVSRIILIAIGWVMLFTSVSANANPDFFRINLPNYTNKEFPVMFYCTAKPNKTINPRILMTNRAQMTTGFKNHNPNAAGQLIIYADQLNKVYFKTYQDPEELDIRGYVQAMGTGEVDINCMFGDGGATRILMPGDYG